MEQHTTTMEQTDGPTLSIQKLEQISLNFDAEILFDTEEVQEWLRTAHPTDAVVEMIQDMLEKFVTWCIDDHSSGVDTRDVLFNPTLASWTQNVHESWLPASFPYSASLSSPSILLPPQQGTTPNRFSLHDCLPAMFVPLVARWFHLWGFRVVQVIVAPVLPDGRVQYQVTHGLDLAGRYASAEISMKTCVAFPLEGAIIRTADGDDDEDYEYEEEEEEEEDEDEDYSDDDDDEDETDDNGDEYIDEEEYGDDDGDHDNQDDS